jgi:hypothetical protein
MRKTTIYGIIIAISVYIGGYLVYINNTYFFNPLSFKKDSITYFPYDIYQKPMAYTYEKGGYTGKGDFIKNETHIKFLYKQFKQSKIIGNSINQPRKLGKPFGCISIYSNVDSSKTAAIVTHFFWYGTTKANDIAEITGEVDTKSEIPGKTEKKEGYLYIKMTPELIQFLQKNFK